MNVKCTYSIQDVDGRTLKEDDYLKEVSYIATNGNVARIKDVSVLCIGKDALDVIGDDKITGIDVDKLLSWEN